MVRLSERFPVGYQYQVRTRVQLSGSLAVPGEKGKLAPKPVSITGESAIDYDERVLALDRDGRVGKTVRVFRRIDVERQLGDTTQKTGLRQGVRRVVMLRLNNREVPFSPDGPLTWGEIDLLRTDVFTPALVGLLPDGAVHVGERWQASTLSVQELTDLEKIDGGTLACRLERVEQAGSIMQRQEPRRRQARVSLSGTVRGTNEDGPTRQELEGYFLFDLESNHLSYLLLRGRHFLLDPEGKEAGRVEGRFVLTRQAASRPAELSDQGLRGVTLDPTAENTRLLYDNADLGLSFLYPRRWRVSGVQGQQVTVDSADGSGLLLTVDPLERVPTGAQFLNESRGWLEKQKGRILRSVPPATVQAAPAALEYFALEAEMGGQRFVMVYYVARQAAGGVTVAARLKPSDAAVLQREVEGIARSLRLVRPSK
ncbi:MAG: hypothetical protein HYS12_06825 [Planctomycetes bacterium]|nr:hypothetical protein [Planctomycetota bacterium]